MWVISVKSWGPCHLTPQLNPQKVLVPSTPGSVLLRTSWAVWSKPPVLHPCPSPPCSSSRSPAVPHPGKQTQTEGRTGDADTRQNTFPLTVIFLLHVFISCPGFHLGSLFLCLRTYVETASHIKYPTSQSFSPLSFRGIVSALKQKQSLFPRILT